MTTIDLRVAIWQVDTYTGNAYASRRFGMSTTLVDRSGSLKAAVTLAAQWFNEPSEREGEPHPRLNVFLGPEYLFVKSPTARVLTMGEADRIELQIKELSKGMLLIPGTVVWKKPLDRANDQYDEGSVRGVKAGQRRQEESYTKTRLEKATEAVDIGRAMELKIAKKNATISVTGDRINKEFDGKSEALKTLGAVAVVRNTAYGYHDGKRVLKYHKRGDYTEVLSLDKDGGEHPVFIPGAANGYFEVTVGSVPVPCGIEICGDHNTGYLSNSDLSKKPLLHFITSAAVQNAEKHYNVIDGGYVIHASANADWTGVFDHKATWITEEKKPNAGGGQLYVYRLSLDA